MSDRRLDLLCDRALAGLDAEEAAELDRLLAEAGLAEGDDALDLAAAAVDLGCIDEPLEELPAALRAKVETAAGLAPKVAAQTITKEPAAPPKAARADVVSLADHRRAARRDVVQYAGWGAAAACLLIAAWAWRGERPAPVAMPAPPPAVTPSPAATAAPKKTAAEEREALLERAKDAVRVAWTATKDPTGQGASGDVVWSNAEQRGYMRFHGLAANDPRKAQFQLWIFDKTRDDRYPIDGGVFDVDAATGDVIVPISAKLEVRQPALFAVTVEAPGGVVVSKREHIVLTAAVAAPG
jgi:hypothetical protein